MPSLQRAVAVSDGEHFTTAVAEGLYLDMARRIDQFFQVHIVVAEVGGRQPPDAVERLFEFRRIAGAAHADTAAPRRALQHHRIADTLGRAQRIPDVLQQAAARQQVHTGLPGDCPCFVFQSETPDVLGPRADKDLAASGEPFRETGVFAQEAVPGMHGLGPREVDDLEQLRLVDVGVGRTAFAERAGFVDGGEMQRITVRLRVHPDGMDTQAPQGAGDPHRNGAPVGDQDLFEHGCP